MIHNGLKESLEFDKREISICESVKNKDSFSHSFPFVCVEKTLKKLENFLENILHLQRKLVSIRSWNKNP